MIIVLALWIIAGLSNGLGDAIKFHNIYPNSHFANAQSWQNVYKNGDPAQGERFFLSTSLLSFTCDAWHLCKEITLSCFALSLAFLYDKKVKNIILAYLALRVTFFIGFYLTWHFG